LEARTLIFLHGFLGTGEDFAFVDDHFPTDLCLRPNLDQFALDSFSAFTESFCDWAKQYPEPRILIGYSLGGRLALHCIKRAPNLWSQLILTSSHTGFPEEEKQKRLQDDLKWCEKLENQKWDDFLEDWNNQAVFGGKKMHRSSQQPNVPVLKQMLMNFSLAKQENFAEYISQSPVPISLIAGELDERYSRLYSQFPKVWLASFSAHRVPWEFSLAWITKIKRIIDNEG